MIISASGMCDAGRVRHHLKHNLWRPESTVLFVGYQSVGTLGRSLVDGAKKVKLFGETIQVAASIQQLAGKSGHADNRGLIKWISSFEPKPEHVFVVHGDDEVAGVFADRLVNELGMSANAPYNGESWNLSPLEKLAEGNQLRLKKPKKEAAAMDTLPARQPPANKKQPKMAVDRSSAYGQLLTAAEKLMALAERMNKRSAGDQHRMTKQIHQIIKRFGR